MRASRKLFNLTPICALLFAGSAFATNGYFPHGYGMHSQGMGGASTALAHDSYGGANNPASMVWVGSRLDLGAAWFSPVRDAERSDAMMPSLNGKVSSDREHFLVPELGYNRMLNKDLSVGVTVYGNGGMNTTYPQGNFNCGGGAANLLCGGGTLGVDLMQLVIAPTVAYKLNAQHSVGASVLLGYQRFKAQGIQSFDNAPGFPPFTGAPGSVTNRDSDSATGAGLRVGYMGRLNDAFSIGASYSSKVNMGRFDQYKGLFAAAGDFDIPSNYSVGLAFSPNADWTIALDYGRINYGGVAAVGNQSMPVAPLGADTGPGFGWKDINVIKLGAAWRVNPNLTVRAGYNKGDNPITASNVTFNILAPGVMTSHYTAGFSYALAKESEVTAALMVAPRVTVSGPSLFNGFMGGAAGNETIGMRQMSLGLAYSHKF
ncbi:MAG: outer membrane protein transport protein [Rhodoferax sp.]|nr:outer membrane protein transport protein [Rhodoferax sp.]